MKKIFIISIALIVFLSSLAYSQGEPPFMPRDKEKLNKIIVYRITEIFVELGLEPNSEKGKMLWNLIYGNSIGLHQYFSEKEKLVHDLRDAFEKKSDSTIIEKTLTDIEKLSDAHLKSQLKYQEQLEILLSAQERAKLLLVEDNFHKKLQRALDRRGHRFGGDNMRPPR